MNPKSGKAGKTISPAKPKKVEEADNADPGKVAEVKAEQRKMEKGKYGAPPVKPFKPVEPEEGEEKETAWIEIQLVGEDDEPIAGERYRITLPDGSVDEGSLDGDGVARVEGFDPGDCKITFPELDKDAWEPA